MCAEYYNANFSDNPALRFDVTLHSQGGTRMMNTAKLIDDRYLSQIDINSYGSATLIPKEAFGDVNNFVSPWDIVPMTNPFRYGLAILRKNSNVHFLSPTSHCPIKEHFLDGDTYKSKVEEMGGRFQRKYL